MSFVSTPSADSGDTHRAKSAAKRSRPDDQPSAADIASLPAGTHSSSSSSSSSSASSTRSKQHKPSHAAASSSFSSFLQSYAETNRYRLGYPSHLTLTPDGDTLLFLRASSSTSFSHDLYSLELQSGAESCLLSASALLPNGASEQLSVEEKAMRERMRLSGKGLQSFFLSPADSQLVLLPFAGQLHLFDRRTQGVTQLTHSSSSPLSPQWSPDGSMISFVRDSDIHLIDVASSTSWQLTFIPTAASASSSSSPSPASACTVTNGLPDFIAAEEMSRFTGHWWSPDSLHIVYQQTDTAGMEVFFIADPSAPSAPPVSFPYPRAGKKNASVRLGIIAVERGRWTGRRSRTSSTASSSAASPAVSAHHSPSQVRSAGAASSAFSSPASASSASAASPSAAAAGAAAFTPLPPITIDDSEPGSDDNRLHLTSLTDQRTGKIVFSPSSHSKRFAYKDRHITDSTIWVQWDVRAFPYLVAVNWSDVLSPLTLVVQSRDQRTVQLLRCETITGNTEELLREQDEHWIGIDQSALENMWLQGGEAFVWSSERSGSWTVELYDRRGRWLRRLVQPELGYRSIVYVDCGNDVLYIHASPDPTQQHLVRVPLGLRTEGGDGEEMQEQQQLTAAVLTRTEGMHKAVIKHSARSRFIHQLNSLSGKPCVAVRELSQDGSVEEGWSVGVKDVAAPLPFLPSRTIIDTVTVPSSPLPLYTAVIPPASLSASEYPPPASAPPRRYPVLVHCYGGPHYQTVTRDCHSFLVPHFFASQDFFVVSIDNRGTPFRTAAFERSIHGRLAEVPVQDQTAALTALLALHPAMDPQRVGIWGWSFGGLMAAMCACLHPSVYCAAVAGAPVTQWADYDSHYTERYLGMPRSEADGQRIEDEGEEGAGTAVDAYAVNSPITAADQLQVPLLLVHGTADDNVYLSHSLLLSAALFRAGRQHEFLPLVNCTHMVADPLINQRLLERMLSFFLHNVRDRVVQ